MTDQTKASDIADESSISAGERQALARSLYRFASGILVPVGLLATWEVAVDLGWISGRLMPPPSKVLRTLWGLFQSDELLSHIWITTLRVLSGFVIGTADRKSVV